MYDCPIYPRTYSPAPAIPKWFRKALVRKGGMNPHGEPNFQLVWGMDARQFSNGNPSAIKYVNPHDVELGWACFVLERWAPPEFFNEEEWNRLRFSTELVDGKYVDHLGPWRRRGSWIMCAPLATEKDNLPYAPLPLEQKVLDELLARIGSGPMKPDQALAQLEMDRQLRQIAARKKLRSALDANFEYHRKKAELINQLASRHTVAPSIGLPVKTTIDEARKILITDTGVTNATPKPSNASV